MAGRATSEDDSRPSDGTTTDGRSKPPLPPWAAPCVPDANRQDPAAGSRFRMVSAAHADPRAQRSPDSGDSPRGGGGTGDDATSPHAANGVPVGRRR